VANSGHSLQASVGGWRVVGMRVEVAPARYALIWLDLAGLMFADVQKL
jgi:hypothetical protein